MTIIKLRDLDHSDSPEHAFHAKGPQLEGAEQATLKEKAQAIRNYLSKERMEVDSSPL